MKIRGIWNWSGMSEPAIDCCLMSTQQFFSYIMARTSKFSMRWWWGQLCIRPTPL